MENYLEENKAGWVEKLEPHLASDFYDMYGFMNGKTSLNKFELDLLGDVSGKKILHLQCHFGQDSISLSRMGAEVTGVDFSEQSVLKGQELATELNVNTKFICSDIYSLPAILDEQFDIVFTSYGTVTWLPDTDKWADVIQRYLKPQGQFVFVDFHPFVWMYDDDLKKVIYKYSSPEAIVEEEEGSYADKHAPIKTKSITWNHGIGKTVNSLLNAGLSLKNLQEYDYSPYSIFPEMEDIAPKKYRATQFGDKVPLVFSIVAEK